MNDTENKILMFLESGYKIDIMLKELNINEEGIADIIIDLDIKELIYLEEKNWKLTQKGKDILKVIIAELLRKLKIDYLYGNINKEEFQKKRKELESVIIIDRPNIEEKVEERIENKIEEKIDKNINCPKCGNENKTGSKYCYKCGEPLIRI